MSPSDYTVQTLELKLKVRSLDNFSKCRELPAKFKKCKIIHYLRKNGAAESACLLRGMCKLNWLFICGNLDIAGQYRYALGSTGMFCTVPVCSG